ncbi:uncharacterized protein LOC117792271 [Drosophila innubila]|uniref:uncharacterized protein LOC117792271 n=1 Tax=Drosophila innubila TaxID=198719 RepID=UPI00148CD331|nr:uncharacterized protein LOC117792271 [Drosophila innubila]
MAQIRPPKFKVNSYKLFRKSYVLAVIQKLKPFINERYAQYLLEESKRVHVPDDMDVSQNGALLQNQKEKLDNFIATTIDPFKPFWQSRTSQGPSTSLSTIGESMRDTTLSDSSSSSDSTGSINQSTDRHSSGSTDLDGIYPMWNNLSDSQSSNLSNSIHDFFASTDNQLPLVNYAVVRPAPRIGHRTEIDMTSIETLLRRPIYLEYLMANVNKIGTEPTLAIELNDQMHLEDTDLPDNNNSNIIDSVPGTNVVRPVSTWFPTTEKFLKFVLTYLVVVFIIGFLFALVP